MQIVKIIISSENTFRQNMEQKRSNA